MSKWLDRQDSHRRSESPTKKPPLEACMSKWLDRQDSNLRMLGPKPSALPLGDGPISINTTIIFPHRKPLDFSSHIATIKP